MKLSGTNIFAAPALAMCLGSIQLLPAEQAAPLETFPEVNRIWMGLEEGTIRPASYQQERAVADGYVSLSAKDGQLIKKGEVWAVFDPEGLDIERSSLALEEDKLERKLKKDAEEATETKLRLALDIHETEGKRQALKDAVEDPAVPSALRSRALEAISKMDERLNLLREKADPATLEADLALGETEGRLVITRMRKELLALEKRSSKVAEFDGELRLSDSVKAAMADNGDGESRVWLSANEHIATIVNDKEYEIVVPATSPVLSQIPREELLVFLQEPKTGNLIAGDYSRTDEVDTGGEIVQNYIFTIQQDSVGNARHSSGQRGLVHIYRTFEKPLRLIHKKDIAFESSEVLSTSGWAGLVRSLWPGSTVVQVGPQTIAVMSNDEN